MSKSARLIECLIKHYICVSVSPAPHAQKFTKAEVENHIQSLAESISDRSLPWTEVKLQNATIKAKVKTAAMCLISHTPFYWIIQKNFNHFYNYCLGSCEL